jgi:hypothetical protein
VYPVRFSTILPEQASSSDATAVPADGVPPQPEITDTVCVTKQPEEYVSVITATPDVIPATYPELFTFATEGLLLVQLPDNE